MWILSQYTTGIEYYVLSYEFLEAHTADWSVGPPKDEADVWTVDVSVEQWADQLESFDYVVVHHTEPAFVERFGELFEDPEEIRGGAVFSVEPSSTGSIQLVPAPAE